MTTDEHLWWEPTMRRMNLAERERLTGLIEQIAALRVVNERLCAIIGAETPIAAFDLATTWRAERAALHEELAAARALSLRLRDAWRAAMADGAAVQRENEMIMQRLILHELEARELRRELEAER